MQGRTLALTGWILVAALVHPGAQAHSGGQAHSGMDPLLVDPDNLTWVDAPRLPVGARAAIVQGSLTEAGQPFILRLQFPPNYRIPAHSHSRVENITILSGTFHAGMGDVLNVEQSLALPAGGVAILPANMNHYAFTKGPVLLQIHGTGPFDIRYANPADDPDR